jgi:cytochrome c oxidase assembly protein subunit 11
MTKRTTLYSAIAIIIGMFSLAFAFVPLYNLFCKVTGYGGTTNRVQKIETKIGTRKMKVYFNADTATELPWNFKTSQRSISTITGKRNLAFFTAKNLSDKETIGTSVYNVTPAKAGKYFSKIECFCFEEQTIAAGETVNFPVSFYIDPEIENDKNLKEVDTITLSYSFFKVKNKQAK